MAAKCIGPYVELVVHGLGTYLVHGPKDLTPPPLFIYLKKAWLRKWLKKGNREFRQASGLPHEIG